MASSKDVLSSMDTHLIKCKVVVKDMRERFENTKERIEELDFMRRNLRERCKVP